MVAPKILGVPGEPGQTVTIRKLGWKALEEAERAFQITAFRQLIASGKSIGDLIAAAGGEQAVRAAGEIRPELWHDAAIVIQRSVLEWEPPRALPEPGSDLEQWLCREILMFSQPSLFEQGEKNVRRP